jgi:uncharacterized protein YlxP (DUF503 family)
MISKFEAKDIYNVHETGIALVRKSSKVFAKEETEQVGELTLVEWTTW